MKNHKTLKLLENMIRRIYKEEISKKTAIYHNTVNNETYKLAGIKDLATAWKVYKTVCTITGWNPETFQDDVKVRII